MNQYPTNTAVSLDEDAKLELVANVDGTIVPMPRMSGRIGKGHRGPIPWTQCVFRIADWILRHFAGVAG